jgi:serine O-acetyltransferase
MKTSFIRQVQKDLINHGGLTFYKKIIVFFFNFNFGLLFTYRLSKMLSNTSFRKLNMFVLLWQNIIYNSYISPRAVIGDNIKFAHAFGIIIGSTIIEDGVIIFQQVTIGSHGNDELAMSWPTIKENTKIYSGAKVLGNIIVGKNVTIGANCVVMKDILDNAILVSPLAKIIGYKDDK